MIAQYLLPRLLPAGAGAVAAREQPGGGVPQGALQGFSDKNYPTETAAAGFVRDGAAAHGVPSPQVSSSVALHCSASCEGTGWSATPSPGPSSSS